MYASFLFSHNYDLWWKKKLCWTTLCCSVEQDFAATNFQRRFQFQQWIIILLHINKKNTEILEHFSFTKHQLSSYVGLVKKFLYEFFFALHLGRQRKKEINFLLMRKVSQIYAVNFKLFSRIWHVKKSFK
jgi:hypothetical protein